MIPFLCLNVAMASRFPQSKSPSPDISDLLFAPSHIAFPTLLFPFSYPPLAPSPWEAAAFALAVLHAWTLALQA